MMAAQGLCPSLFHCVCCERQPVEGEELFFSQQNHGILDKACLGHVNDAKRISAPALYAMQYIVTASLGKLYTFTVTEEVLHELERHIHTYIAANTEKRIQKSGNSGNNELRYLEKKSDTVYNNVNCSCLLR